MLTNLVVNGSVYRVLCRFIYEMSRKLEENSWDRRTSSQKNQ